MIRGYSFRPRLWAWLLAAAGCGLGLALGQWQAGRADEKRALGAQLEASGRLPVVDLAELPFEGVRLAWRQVRARGEYDARHTVFLANKTRGGRPGYEVVTPLRLDGSALHVLVDRGWIAGTPGTPPPSVPVPSGPVVVEGLAQERLPRALAAGPESPGPMRQNLEVEPFAAETGLRLLPLVILQQSASGDGLLREWPRPDTGIDKHAAYSMQWYALGALCVILALVLSFHRVAPR